MPIDQPGHGSLRCLKLQGLDVLIIQRNSSAVDLWFCKQTEAAKVTSWQGV